MKKLKPNLTLLDSTSDAAMLNITISCNHYYTHNTHIGQTYRVDTLEPLHYEV